ncbi:hypothetical protein C3941_13615 [Kaistia algarum]|nr:hypothetical protein C3941_13615 [Kaistia algarum]
MTLKRAVVGVLDAIASEHPLRHQPSKARRYILAAPSGTPLEIMFEQDVASPVNLWMALKAAGPLSSKGAVSMASSLRTRTGRRGNVLYGRHSALERMPQLGDADLVRISIDRFEELGVVLDQLFAASATRVVV